MYFLLFIKTFYCYTCLYTHSITWAVLVTSELVFYPYRLKFLNFQMERTVLKSSRRILLFSGTFTYGAKLFTLVINMNKSVWLKVVIGCFWIFLPTKLQTITDTGFQNSIPKSTYCCLIRLLFSCVSKYYDTTIRKIRKSTQTIKK